MTSEGAESELGTQDRGVDPNPGAPGSPGSPPGPGPGSSLGPRCAPRLCGSARPEAQRRPQPGARTPLRDAGTGRGPADTQSDTLTLAKGGWSQTGEGGAGDGLGPLGFSSEPLSRGDLGTRARKGGGERTAGGFVWAAGLQILHKMEGGLGVSGAACVGCPGCYWVGEAGDSRIPLPAAQRAPSPRAAKVKSSAPWQPPRSGPRRTQEGAGPTRGRLQGGSDSPGSQTGGRGLFLASSPTGKEFPQPGLSQAMSRRVLEERVQKTSEPAEA